MGNSPSRTFIEGLQTDVGGGMKQHGPEVSIHLLKGAERTIHPFVFFCYYCFLPFLLFFHIKAMKWFYYVERIRDYMYIKNSD
jgi:hypothetical protein